MSNAIVQALFGVLSADATLTGLGVTGVHEQVVTHTDPPQEPPYLVLQLSDAPDRYTMGRRVLLDEFWNVKAVDRSASAKRAGEIADRIYALLNLQPLTVTGLSTLIVRREQSFAYQEIDAGLVYHHAGGRYRVEVA